MRITFLLDRPWRWRDLIAVLVTLLILALLWEELSPEAQQRRREESCRMALELRPFPPWPECVYPNRRGPLP